jgi:hypothetical protein
MLVIIVAQITKYSTELLAQTLPGELQTSRIDIFEKTNALFFSSILVLHGCFAYFHGISDFTLHAASCLFIEI